MSEQRRFDDPRWNDSQTALDDHDVVYRRQKRPALNDGRRAA